jgi:hypothetical protein
MDVLISFSSFSITKILARMSVSCRGLFSDGGRLSHSMMKFRSTDALATLTSRRKSKIVPVLIAHTLFGWLGNRAAIKRTGLPGSNAMKSKIIIRGKNFNK